MRKSLKPETLLEELETVASRIFDDIRYEAGNFQTAVCKIKNKSVLIINNRQPINEKIAALASEIARYNHEQIYIKPAVRAEVENYKF